MSLNMSIGCFLNNALIKKNLKSSGITIFYRNLKKRVKNILIFSFPLALKEIIYSSGNWITYYILLQKSNFSEVGIFNSANQLSQIILFLPIAILGVSLSMLSNHVDHNKNFIFLIKKSLLFNFIIVVIIGGLMAAFSGLIYDFYGESYSGGEEVLYILILTTIPMSFISVFEQVCISYSKTILVTAFTLLKYIIIISCVFFFFSFQPDAKALAISFLIGQMVIMISMFLYLKVVLISRISI